MAKLDEKIVVELLKAGDNEAYKYLYDTYYEMLCKFSYYILKDAAQAEGVVNDVIFHLWEKRETLELRPPLRNYLVRAVRNKSLNYLSLKYNKRELSMPTSLDREQEGIVLNPIENNDPLGLLLDKELEDTIHKSINGLPPMCRKVFEMSRFSKMSHEEISSTLKISQNTVKYHIKSALVVLRRELKTFLSVFM